MAFYQDAAKVLDQLDLKQGSLKGLVLGHNLGQKGGPGGPRGNDPANKKRLLALVCETLRYKAVLHEVIDQSRLLVDEKKLNRNLAAVLCHDLLFGKGIGAAGKWKPLITKHQTRLRAELVKYKVRHGIKNNADLVPREIREMAVLPRYVRVNTNKTTLEAMIAHFTRSGFHQVEGMPAEKKAFALDAHIPNLLVFSASSGMDWFRSPLVAEGQLILQDKASCMPAYVLQPPPEAHVMDGCAAPGNKTSHASALMGNTGRIFAFDQDARRCKTLEFMTQRAGCTNITTHHQSFFDADPQDPQYAQVTHILLDPSCSGSGIVNRLDALHESQPAHPAPAAAAPAGGGRGRGRRGRGPRPSAGAAPSTPSTPSAPAASHEAVGEHEHEGEGGAQDAAGRVAELATFQRDILLHAMKFSAVTHISYSTCSIHDAENEDVVAAVLAANADFECAPMPVLNDWSRRGHDRYPFGRHVVRCMPEDATNGFFVALFKRKTV
ncbi:S-adenosyl-L-methionine-dependent methyltransferase [Caulochytrium protostelioides]|uniref:S-adenosyl-L-methionine-dependent methyltransferase n=1 Tax=Caulochytrium protostelioides TaxID=1555241 RepID=A0A4P9WYU8_9FUNG|nr:S-adenosyl-L-methionine-dependent methyltransferase [Caulochytrium protostelioides]